MSILSLEGFTRLQDECQKVIDYLVKRASGVLRGGAMPNDITPAVLQSAIDEFNKWSDEHVLLEQQRNTVDETLYHYTNGQGLKGILENQTIWFTDYRHMNDPSELLHGIDMVKDVARAVANGADGRVALFLECLSDMLSARNFSSAFEFLIASFSRERDNRLRASPICCGGEK